MATGELSDRQRRCLVALLDITEEREAAEYPGAIHRHAGAIAHRLGFQNGPITHGNGAKDGRSYSGNKAVGAWVTPPMRGLEKRGLVRGRYRFDARIKSYELTPEGRELAECLRDHVAVADPDAAKAKPYGWVR